MNPTQITFSDPTTATELVEYVPAQYRSEGAIVFLGGSLVEGFGNHTSDIDIVVFADRQIDSELGDRSEASYSLHGGKQIVHSGNYRGVRVDVELVSLAYVSTIADELAQHASTTEKTADLQSILDFPADLYTTFNSLRIGVPLMNVERFQTYREAFPWMALLDQAYAASMSEYAAFAEDAIGAIQAGDVGSALFSSRGALGCSVDLFTIACGDTNRKAKWRLRKLHRTGRADVYDLYLNAELEPSAEPASMVAAAKARLRAAQGIISRANELRAS